MDALTMSHRDQRLISLSTDHPDGDSLLGIVLEIRPAFLVIQQVVDFVANGIVVIATRCVEEAHCGDEERCAERILRAAQTTPVSTPISTPISAMHSLPEIFTYLKDEAVWPGVEVVYDGRASFYLGPVTAVADRSFRLHCYDAAGRWEKEYELDYDEVFKIEIDSRYVRRFNRFMQAEGGPPSGVSP